MPTGVATSAYYEASVREFLRASSQTVMGCLVEATGQGADATQIQAWREEIRFLCAALPDIDGTLLLEFTVPRLGSRIDAVILSGPALFVVEFKVGERQVSRADMDQVWDYALDLKNFHEASHVLPIFPLLVVTESPPLGHRWGEPSQDRVFPPVPCAPSEMLTLVQAALAQTRGAEIDGASWLRAAYRPTPSIIEAARALYANHSVEAIARSDAGARNLAVTSSRVESIVEEAQHLGHKAVIFVTGVPGAGKTLVGLNVAARRRADTSSHAVFLSGNGPLVKVLREALTLDELRRVRARGTSVRKGDVQQKVKAFIQNVHHFRDEGLNQTSPPADRIVIFDEAQRAWTREMTADFMKRKKGRPDFSESEPEFLLSYMSRHAGWAAVVCLVVEGRRSTGARRASAPGLKRSLASTTRGVCSCPLICRTVSMQQVHRLKPSRRRATLSPTRRCTSPCRSVRFAPSTCPGS